MNFIIEFLKNLDWGTIAVNAIVVGLILSKPFISKLSEKTAGLLTKKRETEIEQQIKSGFEQALTKYKSDLEIDRLKYQINYSFYYNERAKSIQKIFSLMVTFYSAARQITQPIKGRTEKDIKEVRRNYVGNGEKSYDYYKELKDIWAKRQIFFTEELTNDIKKFYERISNHINEYLECYYSDSSLNTNGLLNEDTIQRLNHISEKMNIEEQNNLDDFAHIFRELICPPRETANHPSTNSE